MSPPPGNPGGSGLPASRIAREMLAGYPIGRHIRNHESGLLQWQRQQEMLEWSQRLGAVFGLSPMELSLLELLGKLALPPLLGEQPEGERWEAVFRIFASLPRLPTAEVKALLGGAGELSMQLGETAPDWDLMGRLLDLSRYLQLDLTGEFASRGRTRVPLVRVGRDSARFMQVIGDAGLVREAGGYLQEQLSRLDLELELETPPAWWYRAASARDETVALTGHFDTHGTVLTALTERRLRRLGIPVYTALSYEWSGSIRKFWKRTWRRLIDRQPHWIVLHDLTIDSRRPHRTFDALQTLEQELPDTRLVWLDHHDDTITNIDRLSSPERRVILGPAAALCWAPGLERPERKWLHVAARTDKDITVRSRGELVMALDPPEEGEMLESLLDDRGPTENDRENDLLPYPELLQLVSEDRTGLLSKLGSELDKPHLDEFSHRGEGRVIVGNERPPGAGRRWYELLETAMEQAPGQRVPADRDSLPEGDPYMLWLRRPWAIGFRQLNENTINLLCLTHWLEPGALPVGWFTPEEFGELIGYEQAGWIEVEKGEEQRFIEETVDALNEITREGLPEYFNSETRQT